MPKFPLEIIQTLKALNQGPVFLKFHTIPSERDEDTDILYSKINLIQASYISKWFELNIETIKKFEPFRFNESWVNYN